MNWLLLNDQKHLVGPTDGGWETCPRGPNTVRVKTVAQPAENFGVGEKFGGLKFEFRQATFFCLEHRLSKHKMTKYAKIWVRRGPMGHLTTPMREDLKLPASLSSLPKIQHRAETKLHDEQVFEKLFKTHLSRFSLFSIPTFLRKIKLEFYHRLKFYLRPFCDIPQFMQPVIVNGFPTPAINSWYFDVSVARICNVFYSLSSKLLELCQGYIKATRLSWILQLLLKIIWNKTYVFPHYLLVDDNGDPV